MTDKNLYTKASIDDRALIALAQTIINMAAKQGLMIGTAESCTGGWIGKILTDCSGSSRSFSGGITAYSNVVKNRVLKISSGDLEQYGAVSPNVAAAMAEGAQKTLGVDLAVSVTGIAGPNGGSPEKPVGMVCFGLCAKGQVPTSETMMFEDNGREFIRRKTVKTALDILLNQLQT